MSVHIGISNRSFLFLMGAVLCSLCGNPALAQLSGGGYSLIDLVSPYHLSDNNWSDTEAIRVSNRDTTLSPIFVIGSYARDSSGARRPCLWTISTTGSASVLDLSATLFSVRALNSTGMVGGSDLNDRPAIRLPSGLVITLPTPGNVRGEVLSVTELIGTPGARTFFAVGTHGITSAEDALSTLWVLDESGNLLETFPLRDSEGTKLLATDINSDGELTGTISVDGISEAATYHTDDLFIESLLLSYPRTVYLWECHTNDTGDVMAEAGEPIPGQAGVYRRTFVWPVVGDMINLSDLNGGRPVAGKDLATVEGQSQIVGEAYSNKGWFGFVFRNGQLQKLDSLVSNSSWNLWGGRGISNDGHIVGKGRLTVRRNVQYHGFLLMKN